LNPELSSKFTLSDDKTITIFVKRFHSKAHCAPVHGSIATKTLSIWQQNGDSGIRPSVTEPEKPVLQNRPIPSRTLYIPPVYNM
jgi:hypothetical protein